MWLMARYRPVSAFSLRSSLATSSGGRTNLVPSMYAVKLALVDAAFRAGDDGAAVFEMVKNLPIRFEAPRQAVVSNSFIKIRREPKDKADGPAFISSVAFREFCQYQGDLTVAIDVSTLARSDLGQVRYLLNHVNYFGKRGSFFQFLDAELFSPVEGNGLPASFGYVVGDERETIGRDVIVQYLDDVGPGATFENVSTFSDASARLGRDRVLVPVALPYRRVASSRGYTHYERTA